MVKDRLSELKSVAKQIQQRCQLGFGTLEVAGGNILQLGKELTRWIRTIRDNIEEMQRTVSTPSFHYNDKVIRGKVEKKMDQNIELCKHIHAAIKQLHTDLEQEEHRGSALFRIKHTQFIVIKDDYLSAYREHEDFVNYYEDKIKNLMKKEAKTMSYNITDDEASAMLASNHTSPFVGNILEETERERQKLRDIIFRHSQLAELEKSLVDIRDLFVRISTLVMEQGSLVQVIEYHAQQATLNTDHGAHQLEKARIYKLKAMKKKTCIIIWVVIILSVLVLLMIIF
ncbi:syntaxin-4 isoform X2 [Topomyia yanbarensis]|uniref:syntaxin-4 isoform X2 n=1 Tax=Topomyia yanbarensis TaxID=2498891 RepID=UPI00273CA8FB|nr:syntaxin-4 isoform X2 [Topomyia yanbarensis]